jgi:hypothetical protein
MEKYTIKEKLDGKDLHGLSCRIPTPTPEQAECSHTRTEDIDEGYECDFSGEWIDCWERYEVSTCEDIPGTNNLKCTMCGYTRRY